MRKLITTAIVSGIAVGILVLVFGGIFTSPTNMESTRKFYYFEQRHELRVFDSGQVYAVSCTPFSLLPTNAPAIEAHEVEAAPTSECGPTDGKLVEYEIPKQLLPQGAYRIEGNTRIRIYDDDGVFQKALNASGNRIAWFITSGIGVVIWIVAILGNSGKKEED